MPMLQRFEVTVVLKMDISAATVIDATGRYPAQSNAIRTALNLLDSTQGEIISVTAETKPVR